MKCYVGRRDDNGTAHVDVLQAGRPAVELDWWKTTFLRNHSPTGPEWGYLGSGPAQLALSILLDVCGEPEVALGFYQRFKREVVAKFDQVGFMLTDDEVKRWFVGEPLEL